MSYWYVTTGLNKNVHLYVVIFKGFHLKYKQGKVLNLLHVQHLNNITTKYLIYSQINCYQNTNHFEFYSYRWMQYTITEYYFKKDKAIPQYCH